MERTVTLLGRVLLALIFIVAGIGKIMDPAGTLGYMESMGMPAHKLFLYGAILVELGGGLLLLLGFKAKQAAFLLFIFMIPTTLIFHRNVADQMQMVMFLKNLAIMGGLLTVFAHGPGPASLDLRQKN